jgi:hypothetical protein
MLIAAEVAATKLVLAALVAVTLQLPTAAAVNTVPAIVQLALFDAKVTAPMPDPPIALKLVVLPKVSVLDAADAVSAACVAGLMVMVMPADVAWANAASAALVAVMLHVPTAVALSVVPVTLQLALLD